MSDISERAAPVFEVIDAGRDHYKADPEALLISVARRAAAQYASKEDQLAFLMGYQQARLRHDDYKNEPATDAPTDPA